MFGEGESVVLESFQVEASPTGDIDLFYSGSKDQDSDKADGAVEDTIEKQENGESISKIKRKEVMFKYKVSRYLSLKNTDDDPFTYENKVKCKVTFTVSKSVILHGVGLYCKPDSGMLAMVQVSKLINGKTRALNQTPWLQVSGDGEIAEVSFLKSVILTPDLPYSITASIKGGRSCLGQNKIEHFHHVSKQLCKKVFFKFIESGKDGQIPVIIFSHIM